MFSYRLSSKAIECKTVTSLRGQGSFNEDREVFNSVNYVSINKSLLLI